MHKFVQGDALQYCSQKELVRLKNSAYNKDMNTMFILSWKALMEHINFCIAITLSIGSSVLFMFAGLCFRK